MLSAKAVDNAAPRDKIYRLPDGHGLYLEVSPAGGRYWRFRYEFMGKERRLAVGIYPQMSLSEARAKHRELRLLIQENVDPAHLKKETKAAAILGAANTFELVAREWHSLNLARWSSSHAQDILHRLEKDIFRHIGSLPIASIKPLTVLAALRVMEERGANELARRALQYCGQIFRYAVITERAPSDPTATLKGVLMPFEEGNFAAFSFEDLPEFIAKLERNDARLFQQTRNAIRLLMLTFVRTSELIEAPWNEIDFENKRWVIPAERMKMKRQHVVPLSTQAIETLTAQQQLSGKCYYVFPGITSPRRGKGEEVSLTPAVSRKCMSNMTILKALERMGYKGRMTGHGFRALAMSTIKEKLGYRHEVVDRQLAHAPRNKIEAAYDRATFFEDRSAMMQRWGDYLDGCGCNNGPSSPA